ncbi:MAG: ATPase domain-containing protein [Spirochaetales bacterium]
MAETAQSGRVSSGVEGIDDILGGGLPEGRIYLVHGEAGTGKTTFALQFLMAGARAGKRCLGITLLQTQAEIKDTVVSHNWDVDGIDFVELPPEVRRSVSRGQTVFATGDVELSEVTDAVEAVILRHKPECLVLDSLSELGILVDTRHQLRRQLIRLKETLDTIGCTTILTAGPAGDIDMEMLRTLVHGVISLEILFPAFGQPHRRVLVSKIRGLYYQGGYHDATIVTGGLQVYKRVLGLPALQRSTSRTVLSGNPGLDELLGGGLQEGTTCAVAGTAGAGKSSLVTLYAYTAAKEGTRSAVFCFDERPETFLSRAEGLGMPIAGFVEDGTIQLHEIRVGEVTPGLLHDTVRRAVDQDGARLVVLDSLSGYLQSVPGSPELIVRLHELLTYLSASGVLTFLIVASHGLFGETESPIDISYIADAVVILRHFEARGRVRRCIAVLKKRYGDHEKAIREAIFEPTGIRMGEPLSAFSGLLTGLPRFEGSTDGLLVESDEGPQ